MAERRMFTKKITDDDNFMTLSSSAQALYLHLSMCADDDGFCNQVAISMFKAHASVQDLEALLEKRYIYQFENGVIVIKHWRMANALRKDRYTPTVFQEELKMLDVKENGSYTWLPNGCQMVADRLPQDSIDKISTEKDRSDKDSTDKESKPKRVRFVPPTIDEIDAFIFEKNLNVDAESFFYYYQSNGWKVGRNSMKDWKSTLYQWNAREKKSKPKEQNQSIADKWANV